MKTQKRTTRKALSVFCVLFTAIFCLILSGCGETPSQGSNVTSSNVISSTAPTVYEDGATIGQGSVEFSLVVDNTEDERKFTILTDEETVGSALVECGIVSGEEGPYGLFIDTVNGKTVIFEEDQAYWAFYVNGEYATAGVSETPVEAGAEYALKVES